MAMPDFDTEPKPSRRLWAFAALGALVLHIGGGAASVAAPALAEQKAEVKETELPKDVPTESNDADRVVTPNSPSKPKEEDAKIAEVETSASMESLATEATAMPSSEAIPEGVRSVAPALG